MLALLCCVDQLDEIRFFCALILAATVLDLVAVLMLSLLPPSINMPTTGWDKLNHPFAFGILALLSSRAYLNHFLRLFVLLLAYGGLIEISQSFTTYRLAEWADLLADGIGLIMLLRK